MSKADKTRAFVIEQSARLFNIKGYRDTSLADVIEATGLTKGSIYGNFENKDELAVAVYQYNYNTLVDRLATALQNETTAQGKLTAFTGYYRENWKKMFERGGCPILNASVEADDNFDVLKTHIQQSITQWVGNIYKIIQQGQSGGEFRKDINAKEQAWNMITILEGGIMLAKIMNNHKLLFQALDRIEMIMTNELMN